MYLPTYLPTFLPIEIYSPYKKRTGGVNNALSKAKCLPEPAVPPSPNLRAVWTQWLLSMPSCFSSMMIAPTNSKAFAIFFGHQH